MSNATTITGNLTREPEIRYTKEGQATTTLGVAVNRRWQDKSTQNVALCLFMASSAK
jgi:single-strand DNA-binding protein